MAGYTLGKIGGLKITAHPSALVCFVILWAVFGAAGVWLLALPALDSILGGLAAAFLHYLSELFHQFGHARAARQVGYPMLGVRMWTVIGLSIYPKDEPALPAKTHIRRALGGPTASAIVTAVGGAIAYFAWPQGDAIAYVVAFFFWDNLLFFWLGSLLPLGFTDGSTLLRWWGQRK